MPIKERFTIAIWSWSRSTQTAESMCSAKKCNEFESHYTYTVFCVLIYLGLIIFQHNSVFLCTFGTLCTFGECLRIYTVHIKHNNIVEMLHLHQLHDAIQK